VRSTVEALEGNKVKVSVEVDEAEFEKAIDTAFKRIAKEVRIPGVRPGKAPRRVLEARLGPEYGRSEALREALPEYYVEAVKEHEVDVIASPEFDITDGADAGAVSFDAVVEIRPTITLAGYDALTVTLTSPVPTDDEVDERIDAFRSQMGELADVERPAQEGDHVTIDIEGSLDEEPLPGLTAEDYLYEIGSGNILPEVDAELTGASAGDELDFEAEHPDPDEDEPLVFHVVVKSVKEKVLPELTDEWAKENTEFGSVDEYRADVTDRMTMVRKAQANLRLREAVAEALAELVTDDVPEAMVVSEMDNQLQNLAMRLSSQGVSVEQYLAVTGRDVNSLREEMRAAAEPAVKVDLALRAVADAEGLEVTDDDLVDEIGRLAERLDSDAAKVRAQLERNGQIPAVRSDLRKQKAYDWLSERVTINDEDGNPIARELLEIEQPSDEADAGGDPAPDSDTQGPDTSEPDSTKEDA
jgi:trigger factor